MNYNLSKANRATICDKICKFPTILGADQLNIACRKCPLSDLPVAKQTVVICINGGLVSTVYAEDNEIPIEILICDYDNLKGGFIEDFEKEDIDAVAKAEKTIKERNLIPIW